MHGSSSGSALVANAEVDSMGGVVDGGVGIGIKPSPRRAAIEKAQADLRQEYDFREERRRELEFLVKGGNPLDFKLANAASASVQSTSLTDQHPEQIVTSEAKGSFALTASAHGDSVESSGRPGGTPLCEPNSADNLMLFDGENEYLEGERNPLHRSRNNVYPSEQSSQLDGSQNAKESGDSAVFGLSKKAYKRRNRSRPNRDSARSSSTDVAPSRGAHVPSRHVLRDAKGLIFTVDKDKNASSNSNSKATSPKGSTVLKTVPLDSRLDMEVDGQTGEATAGLIESVLLDAASGVNASKNLLENQHIQSDALETAVSMASGKPEPVEAREPGGLGSPSCVATTKAESLVHSGQINGFSTPKGDIKNIPNEGENTSAALSMKGLDSESSGTQTSLRLDGNLGSDKCFETIVSNGNAKEQTIASEDTHCVEGDVFVKEKKETKADESCAFTAEDCNSVHKSLQENGSIRKLEEESKGSGPRLHDELKRPITLEGKELDGLTASETERKATLFGFNSAPSSEIACTGRRETSVDSSIRRELPGTTSSVQGSTGASASQICSEINLRLESKAHEDSILEEARIIEAKRKRIAELSVATLPLENRRKSHWQYVLDEMAWLANDFAQERLWKITAAAQISQRVAFASHLRHQEKNSRRKQKEVAHNLAKAVMEFWHSVEGTNKELELQHPGKAFGRAVQGYALRFLKHNNSHGQDGQAEAPLTPDRISDLGTLDMSWEDQLTEEILFYTVPLGAMEAYRKSVESRVLKFEKTGSIMQEEVETSDYDAVADFGSQEHVFEEDEGETSTYYLPGAFEGSRSSKFAQKKRKNMMKAYNARSYEVGADLPFTQCMENKVGTQQSVLTGKRPANSLNVAIPIKRVRTAYRQRVASPFGAGTSGCVQGPNKTDASSGDTNSFQDDQSTLHGGLQIPNGLEVDSVGDFQKQLPFDSAEVSNKPKKKKKAKHLGATYEHRWQLDSNFHHEQRDQSRKRLESHQLESNGSSGLFGQPNLKKPKRQLLDNSVDNLTPMSGSIPSPAASQMSNMSNPNKFIKMLGGRERGRKSKGSKMPAAQPGSGSAWSLFEDQALVVLVHDMGPNWELVSDAINSTLQFKCIFHKPKECKERHKFLMDKTGGDGADSAEDSGSSQPYPSTLPGIPKGSARQLFQRLQGPMEEDTLKSHFEKIIMIGQKQQFRRIQSDIQDAKQLQQSHVSHTHALSQVCPNNLNGGGPVLTPLDLCDTPGSSPEALGLGYQSPHSSGLPISNQGTLAQMLPASGANSPLQGSSSVVLGSNVSSPSGSLQTSARYGIPRTASLSIDEQQRLQQYNQMISGRNIQQPSSPVPGAIPGTDRGVRMLAGGNGMGVMGGMTRSMPMSRPGFQGIASSSMLNSGSMLSSGMVAMTSPVNMHTGPGHGQGNSMLRPRDALHLMRPEHQRQMIAPELQMQVSQGNSQGVSPFVGLSPSFSNQTASPPYPLHHQQSHPMSPQQSHALNTSHHQHLQGPNHATNSHQAYAIRFAKERHLQQRILQQQQQQQQFSPSNPLMPHVQQQSQLPISSPPSQSSSSAVSLSSSSMTPILQHPQKHHMPPHGLGRNPQSGGSALPNQMGKQRRQPQQQQFQQAGRHHPQQRQQTQGQQQAKVSKGVGRGNMMTHPNLPIDPTLLNGLPATPGNQSTEKGEQAPHLGQGLYSGSGLNSVLSSKQSVPPHSSNHSQPQQKIYSTQAPPSSKKLQQIPSHSDTANQNHVQPVASAPTLSTSHQTVPPSIMASSNQTHLKVANQTQPNAQRVLQPNCQVNSHPQNKLQARESQAEQHTANNSSQVGITAATPQTCIDSTNVVPVVSSASAPPWKVSDPSYDSGMPNHAMHLGSTGNLPLTSSTGSESPAPASQGPGQRQFVGHDGGVQWQPSQLQPPAPLSTPQQLQQQSPQQQTRLHGGPNSSHLRPTNTKPE